MIGHVPLDASLTNVTVIGPVQLSASSVTTVASGAGTSAIHVTVTGAGLLAVYGTKSCTVIVSVAVILLPHASVTLYVLVIMIGHVPLDTSLTCVTVIGPVQLSASSVTTVRSGAGTSAIHATVTGAGLLAVGGTRSCKIGRSSCRV